MEIDRYEAERYYSDMRMEEEIESRFAWIIENIFDAYLDKDFDGLEREFSTLGNLVKVDFKKLKKTAEWLKVMGE